MCKVIRIFQQTFNQGDTQKKTGVFQFPRYMKTRQDQHFRLKVLGVSSNRPDPGFGGGIFIRDFPVLNMNCNYNSHDNNNESGQRFYLGNFGQPFTEGPTMLTDDIPMSPFTIEQTVNQAEGNDFQVTFQIELLQPED